MKNKSNSPDKRKQKISDRSDEPVVSKVESKKSRSEEIADKSEGFGGSPEELDDQKKSRKE